MTSNNRQFFIILAVIVILWYLGLSYLPGIVGTCFDGACGFTVGEILISFIIPLVFFAVPVLLEMLLYKKSFSTALSDIGITRFSRVGVRLALIYLLPLIAFYPLFALLANVPASIQPMWFWLIMSAVLNNGLCEETMMRGFVFRHLRQGRTFWRAAALSTVYFAGYHLPLILTAGPVIGIFAVVLAIPTGFVTAYVYERGKNTIWGSALLHTVYNGLAYIVVLSADKQAAASSLYLLLGIIVAIIMLVVAYRGGYQRVQVAAA